ncbi:MAG: methyltransferase domain-containing protein [Patescibacteria group bacterium]|jgi:tRNA (guanine10-N2)-dimethyltransferase
MNKYLFMLGQSPDLAQEELKAILSSKNDQIELYNSDFVLANTDQAASDLINVLGGTIKIARYLQAIDNLHDLNADLWYSFLAKNLNPNLKNCFGFSLYNDTNANYNTILKIAFKLKRTLKNNNYKCRLVTGQDPVLSSVIVAKNKLIGSELLIIKYQEKYILALTEAVQDFVAYGFRDMKRPHRDDRSGMLAPKVAQMMVNLAGNDKNKNILDPFCGSGTILQEAMLLGYKKIYGSDISPKAVKETSENLDWLSKNFHLKANIKILESSIENLANNFAKNSIDLIVTEPFMGDARIIIRQNNSQDIIKIKDELQMLYKSAFTKFKKIISSDSLIIFIFPIFHISNQDIYTLDKQIISQLGFKYQLDKDIIYSRANQKVARQITVWKLKK